MFEKVADDKQVIITGATWNQMVKRLEAQSSPRKSRFLQDYSQPPIVKIRNTTGTNLPPFRVVEIASPVVLPGAMAEDLAFKQQHVFNASDTTTSSKNIAITLEGVPASIGGENGIGRAVAVGVCTAVANISSASHQYLAPAASHTLESTFEPTTIRLWYAQGVGTDRLCKVLIGIGESSGSEKHYKTPTGGIPAATLNGANVSLGSASCERYDMDTGTDELVPSGENVTVYNSMPAAIGGGKIVNTQLEDGRPVVIVDPCNTFQTGSGFSAGFSNGFG